MRCVTVAASGLALLIFSGCLVTPQPFTDDDHRNRFIADTAEVAASHSEPQGPIGIHEAIARSIKYNMDNRLAQMEAAFSLDQLAAAKLQMLPRLALNAGYSIRNNESASSSISYQKRSESLEPSVSAPVNRVYGDLSFSWSLLDFGIGYYQAKQQANRFLILLERRRRIMNNLVKEVIAAYCRCASLERARPRVEAAIAEAEQALESYRKVEADRNAPIADALDRQRSLLVILGQLRQLANDLAMSRSRLAALMNLPPGHPFTLDGTDETGLEPPRLDASLAELEDIGVYFRPDLREEAYMARIEKDEVKKEMIRMFPGVTAFMGGNYDSNHFLVHHFWTEAGTRATMDIMGLAARFKQYQAAKTQTEVARIRRLATTVSALVQIDMSYYQYLQAIASYNDAREIARIDRRLLEVSSAAAAARNVGRLEVISQNVASVNSLLDMDRRRADVLTAWANLYFSIGCDMLPDSTDALDLDILVRMSRDGLGRWLAGELPDRPGLPEWRRGEAGGVAGAAAGEEAGKARAAIAKPAPETAHKPARPVAVATATVVTRPKPQSSQ